MFTEEEEIDRTDKTRPEKMEKMPSLDFKPMLTSLEMDRLPIRNSQLKNRNKAYTAQDRKEKGVDIGDASMFTGNAWFDIGLALGRKHKAKTQSKKK